MKKELVRRIAILLILLGSSFPLFQLAIAQRSDRFLDLFISRKQILGSEEYDIFEGRQLSDYMASQYLCDIKNDCLVNPLNGYSYSYYAMEKVDYKSYWILLYGLTDGYTINIYLASYSPKYNRIISKLWISEVIVDDKIMCYEIDKEGMISIYRDYPIGGGIVTKKETYRMDSKFSRIDKKLSKSPHRNTIIIDATPTELDIRETRAIDKSLQ